MKSFNCMPGASNETIVKVKNYKLRYSDKDYSKNFIYNILREKR